jgi:hypothetical protein
MMERVPRLVDLAVSALARAFTFITRLPPLPPEFLNQALARAMLDRRVLALALGAGATRLHVYDFWELCNSFPAAWHCWQEGTSAAAPPPPRRAMPAPACMVEVRDGVLQPSQYDWMRIFPLTSTLEVVSLESQDTEEEDSGAQLRLVLRQLAKMPSLRRLSIAFFDTVTDATLAPLWGAFAHGPYEAFDDPTETQQERLDKERVAAGLYPHPSAGPGGDVTAAMITRLDLSHLPRITDAAVHTALSRLPHLTTLRLEFLAVTDKCIRDWRRFKMLTWLEVRACPYMKFAYPEVDFQSPPPRLTSLRIHPGGSRRGGRSDMSVSARDLQQLAAAPRITHLCLGCRFKAPTLVVDAKARGAGASHSRSAGTGGSGLEHERSQWVLDLRVVLLPTVTHLELYHCRQITWPSKFRRWTQTLRSLVVEEATDSLVLRLADVPTLRSLTVCNAASMSLGEFAALGELGPELEELVIGGVREALDPLCGEVVKELGPKLTEAHFHRCVEYPTKLSIFT